MTSKGRSTGSRRGFSLREGLGYGVIASAVWLGWQIVQAPIAARSLPVIAVRAAPTSPEVLRRAAEGELQAGRPDNALSLSAESLIRSPFNARALRVYGLARARQGREDQADEILTLAGNWSLRDDPAHAWLIERRLLRGDYASSFAHADTLVRRRDDLYPSIFNLFATASSSDPRSLPALVRILEADPPWRLAFLDYLYRDPARVAIAPTLAVALERSRTPFTTDELRQLYANWVNNSRYPGLRQIRGLIGRPSPNLAVQNGDFSQADGDQITPFGWTFPTSAGISSQLLPDDLNPENRAFRLQYDGFDSGKAAEQMLLLDPGEYVLTGRQRSETPQADMRLRWNVICAETGGDAAGNAPAFVAVGDSWSTFQVRLRIPDDGCTAQWLRLAGSPGDRRTTLIAWLDDLQVRRVASSQAPLTTSRAPISTSRQSD